MSLIFTLSIWINKCQSEYNLKAIVEYENIYISTVFLNWCFATCWSRRQAYNPEDKWATQWQRV